MNRLLPTLLLIFLLTGSTMLGSNIAVQERATPASLGFSPSASGAENRLALQRAVDQGGTIRVEHPGVYDLSGTVYVGDNTSLIFDSGVFLRKVDEQGAFSHVLVNKGAKSKTYNYNIRIEGLQIMVNGVDVRDFEVAYGLHGQLAFFYVKDLRIERFRCLDLGKAQYGIHVCTFEDLLIDDVIIDGYKDGVHLGRGKRFCISNCTFRTFDDAIALNGHDYSTGNPELGWIEDGVVEKCYDMRDDKALVGYFCRILAGAWCDWESGMEVQQSDAVVSGGRLYRVQAQPDGTIYRSLTRPTHTSGAQVLDGINWGVVQEDEVYSAGVRNVVFRDIFLSKPRVGFSVHFDNDRYSRSYYPGAESPIQEQILFDNIRVLYDEPTSLLSIKTPMDVITITNSVLRNSAIHFMSNGAMEDFLTTRLNITSCTFTYPGEFDLIRNSVEGKQIQLQATGNILGTDSTRVRFRCAGDGLQLISSDLQQSIELK